MSLRGLSAGLLLLLAPPLWAARLGDRVVPERYELQIAPDLVDETFAGDETIDLQIRDAGPAIRLHALDLEVTNATLRSGGESIALAISIDAADETVTLTAPRIIPAGSARLTLHFAGHLNQELHGFYVSHSNEHKYALTQFEATDARRAFPCFDEPSFKAVFDIRLLIDSGDMAISNAPVVSDTRAGRGKHLVRFAPTPKISSYLVAMLVGDFRCARGMADDVPIRVCAAPGQERLTRFALTTAEEVLHYDDVYFGIHYPFAKLDLVAVPEFEAGAMENAGAITFRESFLLLDDATASMDEKKLVAGVIAHEIAHMWFGDLVTMKWWDDIWLNEGFATLMTRRPLEAWHPEWRLDLDAVDQTLQALASDARRATRPIRTRVETPREIFSLFDGIAYGKTSSVLWMIEEWLGPDLFRTCVHDYLTRYAWSNAGAEDFWASMTASSGQPVDAVLRSFVEQPGAPLLDVAQRCEGGKRILQVSQHRLQLPEPKSSSPGKWTLPLCVRSTADPAGLCKVVTPETSSVELPSCAGSLFWNRDGAGYYVPAPTVADRAEIEAHASALSGAERLAVHGDRWLLVRGLREPVGGYLDLLHAWSPSLNSAPDREILVAMASHLQLLDQWLVGPSNRSRWQQFIRQQLGGVMERRWEVSTDDRDLRQLRAFLLALQVEAGGDREAAAGAHDLALRFLQKPESVDPVVAAQALPVAAQQGDRAMFQAVVARLGRDAGGWARDLERAMLASFRDPVLAADAVAYAFSPSVRVADRRSLILTLMQNPVARPAAWRAIQEHWPELQQTLPTGLGPIVGSTGRFCDAAARGEVQRFFANQSGEGVAEQLPVALASIDGCIAFREKQQASFDQWLARMDAPKPEGK